MSSSGPLEGIQVIEVSAFVAAPFAGMVLAQLGADVIRVDPVGGGIDRGRWPVTASGASLYWAGLNAGKRSMAVDMRAEEGRDLVRRLATAPGEGRGIVVTNLSPRWLSFESLVERRADLIMVALAGNPDGTAAVDYTVNAAAGYPAVTGSVPPTNHVLPAWDLLAGSMVATAVLAAYHRRRCEGRGDLVRVSLADVAFATLGHLGQVAEVVINDTDRVGYENYIYGSFGKDFDTGDGRRVMIAALTPRQWSALVETTELTEELAAVARTGGWDFDDEGDRFLGREEIARTLAPWFSARSLEEVARALDEGGVLWGPYRTFRGLVEDDDRVDPEVNPMWSVVDQPGIGRYPAPGSPLRFAHAGNLPAGPAPLIGQDTEELLRSILELDDAEIGRLRARGVI